MVQTARLFSFIVLGCLCVGSANAQQQKAEQPEAQVQPLWPGLPPGSTHRDEGDVPELVITTIESEQPTAAVVILPGGGYGGHAMDHEGHQFAAWFKSHGIASAICNYRLRGKGNDGKGYGHPAPMQDAQRAIQTLRAQAEPLNIDPNRVGVIGFSAGGHLCSTVSTHFAEGDSESEDPIGRVSSRPDFSILCYGVLVFGKPYTHQGSQRNLIGTDPTKELLESLSNERQVSADTPPTFLFHTGADTAVPPQNSVDYYLACHAKGVPAELHIFPEGRHGLGLASQQPGASQWPSLCEDWLRRLGMITQAK
ncbi:alpha/beta hydrolase [Stieleria sp. TO1_6]|uniref:alpha/beta hydrolase n=1 Tax=Stieleria tagensis TaxID=2956795 RepID=UPI00209B14FC|nr:alpha/beta hydrolase [Stieleria tagensis]MCO8120746.1 alpha/beta hydrolase [Stieleria tagensis]